MLNTIICKSICVSSQYVLLLLQDTIAVALFFGFLKFVLIFVLISYLMITLVASGFPTPMHVSEILALATLMTGFILRCYRIASVSHKAFATIQTAKKEIILEPMKMYSDYDDTTLQMRRNELVAILDTAQPLNGYGFFVVNYSVITSIIAAATTYVVVLLQFDLSEHRGG